MATELVWRPKARADLIDIYVAIGVNNPRAAERYFDEIEANIERLRQHPRLGPKVPAIEPNARMLVFYPYVILYEAIPDMEPLPVETVEIVRVLHGRRNLREIVREP